MAIEQSTEDSLKSHRENEKKPKDKKKRHRQKSSSSRSRNYPKLDLFKPIDKQFKKQKSGGERITQRINARAAERLHVGNPNRTESQKNQRRIAKQYDTKLRAHGVNNDEFGIMVANSQKIPASQVSAFEEQSFDSRMGYEWAKDILSLSMEPLSLEPVEEEHDEGKMDDGEDE